MWPIIRQRAHDTVKRVARELTAKRTGLQIAIDSKQVLDSPVFVDCELFTTGTGNSVGLYLDVSVPLSEDGRQEAKSILPPEVVIEFRIKFRDSLGIEHDEEIEELIPVDLEGLEWDSAIPTPPRMSAVPGIHTTARGNSRKLDR